MKPNLPKFDRLFLLVTLLSFGIAGCATRISTQHEKSRPQTFSSFDLAESSQAEAPIPVGTISFNSIDVAQFLMVYQELSQRTVIRPTSLPATTISLRNQTPVTRVEALQLMDTALAANGIATVLVADNAVKVVPVAQAAQESPPEISLPWPSLPDSGSFMMRTVQLNHLRPSELVPVLMPFCKAPGAVVPIDSRRQIILRDYSSNIRKMLKLIEDLDKAPRYDRVR